MLVRRLWLETERATSRLTYPESRSALAVARRAGRIRRGYVSALAQLEAAWQEMDVIELEERVARRAGALAEKHGLRGADGVQLASALSVERGRPTLVTWDRLLGAAGVAEGLDVLPAVA